MGYFGRRTKGVWVFLCGLMPEMGMAGVQGLRRVRYMAMR